MEVLNHAGLEHLIHKISDSYNKLGSDIVKNEKGLGQRIENTISITHARLVSLRDSAMLKPGQQYCITDYVTTTSQEYTQSTEYRFNVIVTAIDKKTLSEEALAAPPQVIEKIIVTKDGSSSSSLYRNTGSPPENPNIITLKKVAGHESFPSTLFVKKSDEIKIGSNVYTNGSFNIKFGTISSGADLYFTDSKLNAWKIWYCLDNDTNRFAWAGASQPDINTYKLTIDGVTEDVVLKYATQLGSTSWYYFKHTNDTVYTTSSMPDNNTTFYTGINGSEITVDLTYDNILIGKGVIYRMIDEWNNDCPYDFKNIRFKHPKDTTTYPGYYYTFSALIGGVATDLSMSQGYCYDNTMKKHISQIQYLNNNVFIGEPTGICYSNSFEINCRNNSFGNKCISNSFGENCHSNSFGNNCDYNSFGNDCHYNSFRVNADKAATLKDFILHNHLGDGCHYNVIWNSDTTSSSIQLKNINVNKGVVGTSDSYNMININVLSQDYEIQVAKNSKGEIKIYCEADLIA